MNSISRKNAIDMESVRLWMDELRETKFYSTMFIVDPDVDSPFLVSWMSPWQKMVGQAL